jgi:glycosyltransferase involved in cell wall biosynthesis
LRILILNWRCPRNPKAGGAETLTFEVARRLVATGHSVEWFSASFPGADSEEDLDGVHIVRAGRQWTVHVRAFLRYWRSARHRFDAVIDEVNTMPFFAPMWAGIPTFMLMFQLAREVWWYESPFPLNVAGFFAEPIYLRPYRRVPVFTISGSTEVDLRRLGFEGPITVMPIGIEEISPTPETKETEPTFLFVGRLAPSKRLAHMLQALAQFRRETGTGVLWLVGSGSKRYERSLARLAQELRIQDSVVLWGHVSTSEKHSLMSRAHCLLMTSVREGWGLVVTEANACGTPAIVYDVPGLRDSVRNDSTGIVVAPRPGNLSDAMRRLSGDPAQRDRLGARAKAWSTTLTYDAASQFLNRALEDAIAASEQPVSADLLA